MRTAFGRRAFSAASALLIGAMLVAGCAKSTTSVVPVTPNASGGTSERVSNPMDFRTALSRGVIKPACSAKPGQARCFAYVRPSINGPTSGPVGYGPPDLQSAYNLASLAAANGAGRVIAVVDAYDDPNAESDLAVYRAMYGLPACTTANGCFHKVNQSGVQGGYAAAAPVAPGQSASWATEISLDLDMVAANCPRCSILLVEANTSAPGDLASSVDTAAAYPGVVAISNSYGIDESVTVSNGHHGFSSVVYAYGGSYDHPGIFITAASRDLSHGTAPLFPAVLATVASIGGTTLEHASNARGWSETAWSGAESSCSAIEYQPAWQSADANVTSVCRLRAVADLAYESDDTTVYGGRGVRHVRPGLHHAVDRRGRDERRRAGHRRDLRRPRFQLHHRVSVLRRARHVVRRHVGLERSVRDAALQRDDRLGRTDGLGHAERRVHAGDAAAHAHAHAHAAAVLPVPAHGALPELHDAAAVRLQRHQLHRRAPQGLARSFSHAASDSPLSRRGSLVLLQLDDQLLHVAAEIALMF